VEVFEVVGFTWMLSGIDNTR